MKEEDLPYSVDVAIITEYVLVAYAWYGGTGEGGWYGKLLGKLLHCARA
jgi:hypothetical protein